MTEVLEPPRTEQQIRAADLMMKIRRNDGIAAVIVAYAGVAEETYAPDPAPDQLARATLLCVSYLSVGRQIHVRWDPYRARAWHLGPVTVVVVYELGNPVAKSINRAVVRAVKRIYSGKHEELDGDKCGHPESAPG